MPPQRKPQPWQAVAALWNAKVARARTSLAHFIELAVKDDHGVGIKLAPIHMSWIRHLNYCWTRELRCMTLAPFGHGKSSSLLVPLCAYMIGQDPNLRIKIITNDDDSASKRVGAVKRILESVVYRQVFPDVVSGGAWTGHELYVKRVGHAVDPTVQARGIFTTGIGGRADIELLDDVVDQKNSMDPIQRRRVLSLLEETWFSRLEPDGNMLAIGTTWHQDDALHHLMHRPRWCTLRQSISDDCTEVEQTVVGARDDYPDLLDAAAV